jgi:hypothetical protein
LENLRNHSKVPPPRSPVCLLSCLCHTVCLPVWALWNVFSLSLSLARALSLSHSQSLSLYLARSLSRSRALSHSLSLALSLSRVLSLSLSRSLSLISSHSLAPARARARSLSQCLMTLLGDSCIFAGANGVKGVAQRETSWCKVFLISSSSFLFVCGSPRRQGCHLV